MIWDKMGCINGCMVESNLVFSLVPYSVIKRIFVFGCSKLVKYLDISIKRECSTVISEDFEITRTEHSSLLSVFGLNATSPNDSYLPLIFGKFALIWGHFQNILTSRFRGRWGHRGQTTSKSKTTKILNENLLKLDEIQTLASRTSKMTSEGAQWIFLKNTFLKSVDHAEKNEL